MLIQGCASIPDTESTLAGIDANQQSLKVVGAKKTYSEHRIDKALQKISPDEEIRLSLEKHLKIEQAISGNSLYADNKVTLLFNGETTFHAMKQVLSAAQNHINLEYFTFEDVDLGGVTLKALLLEKLSQGVKVNIIYDAIGSADTPPELFETLKKAGAEVNEYHPLEVATIVEINQRDHRKIMVIDGKVAIIGGVNLSKTYQSKGSLKFFSKNKTLDPSNAHWRDTDAMIEGPVIADIQRIFVSHWDNAHPLDTSQFYPVLQKKGAQFVHVIATNAEKKKETDSPYYIALIAAIDNAEHNIILNSAYFVPTDAQEKALIAAADRGVHIELLVPSLSDSTLSMHVQRSHYSTLLEHGIEIYEMQDQVLHAKMVSIDHVWSVIGSSNFDYRSAGINAEIDFVILGHEIANALNIRFQEDRKNAKRIDPVEWKNRSILDKIKQQSSRIFEGVL